MTSHANVLSARPQGPAIPADLGSAGQRVHLSGEVHTGSFSIVEFSATPGAEPAATASDSEDRFFCLLEGEWEVRIGDDHFRVKAGGSFHAPRGVSYDYRVLSPLGRAVVLVTRPNDAELS
ncbi:MAG: cupin domain-containing protein [Bryobacterales bacterium]|nr:cupin domain-containing protein [Bryobacterales bacterium]